VVSPVLLKTPATEPHSSKPSGAPLPPIAISLDAREAPRKILHARLVIPVKPGPLTLFIRSGYRVSMDQPAQLPISPDEGSTPRGRTVAWRRDDVDMYAFHLEVPAGASVLDVTLDFLLPAGTEGFFLRRLF